VATFDGARDALRQWWLARIGNAELPQAENGAGLSREARVTAQALARMLQVAWGSPVMPELVASLPITGVDGTLRRSNSRAGTAHLKTGSLRDVMAVAGYVHAASGRRYVLVAVVNHANAGAARPVLDLLTDWTARDQ
jgi:D-alanyl-D-alanine carboxypeptidase/D-alanyl-D-alanine-endopeptidase (penicillin-binding protein 4)